MPGTNTLAGVPYPSSTTCKAVGGDRFVDQTCPTIVGSANSFAEATTGG